MSDKGLPAQIVSNPMNKEVQVCQTIIAAFWWDIIFQLEYLIPTVTQCSSNGFLLTAVRIRVLKADQHLK